MVKITIEQIRKSKRNLLILHYACTSVNIPPVIVTNISVRDYSLNQTFSFSFAKYGHEHNLLLAFLDYMKKQSNYLLVTWNQKSSTYGIQHLEERCRHYGIYNEFSINYNDVVDLDDSLIEKYGQNYAKPSKLDNLAKANNISLLGAESGLREIELFKTKEYKRIENSTNRKVAIISDILRLAINNSLNTLTRKVSMVPPLPITRKINAVPSLSIARHIERLETPPWIQNKTFTIGSNLQRAVSQELKSLQTKQKFKPGLYYLVWADLSDSTKSSEKLTPEENTKKVTDFINFTKESIPEKFENVGFFVKDIGDASLFLFNNFLDILKWKQSLEKKCKVHNSRMVKVKKSKLHLIEYKVIVHLGEIHLDEKGDPKALSLNQLSKIEKDFKKNQFGITEKVRLVILPRVNSKQIKISKIKELKLEGEKAVSAIWNITEFENK